MRLGTLTVAVVAIATFALPVAACSSDHAHPSGMPTIPANADFNATDVGFAQGMIPHHAQALEMADQALATSKDADVLALAAQIKSAQAPEIEMMTGWLRRWGQTVPSSAMGSMAGHDMSGMDGMMMDGMMSQADMDRLNSSTGTAFDRLWLELMIQHHEGAVKMAKSEITGGKNADAEALAQSIISSQQAEIARMNSLLSKSPA